MAEVRLNKQLALFLGISRRQADDLIADGKVTVNNNLAILGQRINDNDEIKVQDKIINQTAIKQILLLHKPVGYVCSRAHQADDKTIYNLLPKQYFKLKSAGRLDKDSSGLLVLSNDGDFIYQMTHPKFHKIKIYEIELDQPLQPLHQQMINDFGVQLNDGNSQLTLSKLNDDRLQWQVTMSQGRNRQIRRTFATLGYRVVKLHRTQFGNYKLNNLQPGQFELVDIS